MADKKKYILVVDDEPDVAAYLTTLLSDNGYLTDAARDGAQALAKVKEKKPDLVTLDMSMPEKSGVRFYFELKDDPKLSDIPVIVVTGVTGYADSSEVFEKFLKTRKQFPPPNGFIPKPIDEKKLLAAISDVLS